MAERATEGRSGSAGDTVAGRESPEAVREAEERASKRLEAGGGHLHITARLERGGEVTAVIHVVEPYDSPTGERTASTSYDVPSDDLGDLQAVLGALLDKHAGEAAVRGRRGTAMALLAADREVRS